MEDMDTSEDNNISLSDLNNPIYFKSASIVPPAAVKGDMDLLQHFRFSKYYKKYCINQSKKKKETLSSYLSDINCGKVDEVANSSSSLQAVYNSPPLEQSIEMFSQEKLRGFKLGSMATLTPEEKNKWMQEFEEVSIKKNKKKKQKKEKKKLSNVSYTTNNPAPIQNIGINFGENMQNLVNGGKMEDNGVNNDLDRISPENNNVDKPAASPADATDQEIREVLPAVMAPGIQAAINGRNSTPLTTELPDINNTPTSEVEGKLNSNMKRKKDKKKRSDGEKKSKKKKTSDR